MEELEPDFDSKFRGSHCVKVYTVFHKKGTPFSCFFIIHSNDDQFTQNTITFRDMCKA